MRCLSPCYVVDSKESLDCYVEQLGSAQSLFYTGLPGIEHGCRLSAFNQQRQISMLWLKTGRSSLPTSEKRRVALALLNKHFPRIVFLFLLQYPFTHNRFGPSRPQNAKAQVKAEGAKATVKRERAPSQPTRRSKRLRSQGLCSLAGGERPSLA